MDILEEIDVFLSVCQLTQDESNNLVFNGITGCFESKYLADWFVNQINFGWKLWQAAKAKAVPEVVTIGNELQSWVAAWSFKARHDREDYIVVDANLLAKKIAELTGAGK